MLACIASANPAPAEMVSSLPVSETFPQSVPVEQTDAVAVYLLGWGISISLGFIGLFFIKFYENFAVARQYLIARRLSLDDQVTLCRSKEISLGAFRLPAIRKVCGD